MNDFKEIGLLEVALEIVGGHSNGLGEGMVTTIDGELKAHSSWHRTYSKEPLLDVVTLVDRGSKEARNLKSNSFTEWTFVGMDKSLSIHLVGTSRILEQLDELGDASLLNDSLLKWEVCSMFHRYPFAIQTRVSSLELEYSGDPHCREFGRDEVLGYVQGRLRARCASRIGHARERSNGFAPSGWGKRSRTDNTHVAAGS
ncbi:hypothetical protein VDG1235_4266 [Verrucomicrobiia bacterium DG1235]|nr:hypothetical protein VDG1235_4266 [Verrucomicrobiae bacterium DG1235]